MHIAIECGVESDEIGEELLVVLQERQTAPDLRAQAACLLGLWTQHADASGRVVAALLHVLESKDQALKNKCSVSFDEFANSKGKSVSYGSLRALVFEELGKFGPAAKDAIPHLNAFLSSGFPVNPVSINRTGPEIEKAIESLGRIGMNAESVKNVEVWLTGTNVQVASGVTLADIAAEALSRIPAEQLKRLRDELSQPSSK